MSDTCNHCGHESQITDVYCATCGEPTNREKDPWDEMDAIASNIDIG
jgi:ribosomal protein L37E